MGQIDNFLRLSPGDLSEAQWARLKASLTFQPNPGTLVWSYREFKSGEKWLPRGIWHELPKGLILRDKRSFPKMPKLDTNIVLDYRGEEKKFYGQRECIEAMFDPRNRQQGFIHRQPGSGKSNIACYFMANVGTRSLVIVHTEDLLNQWVEYIERVIPSAEIGEVRQGTEEIGHITIAMLQTLYRREYDADWYRQFGCTIQDECLHAPANTFDEVLAKTTSRYRFGLSASENRADNMQPLVKYTFGKTIHQLEFASAVPVTVERVRTNFTRFAKTKGNIYQQRRMWHEMIKLLVQDEARNKLIAKKVNKQLAQGRSVLILSRRIEHLQNIQDLLDYDSEVLAAKLLKKPERIEILDRFKSGELKCVLATQLADEGLDVPILSCVVLAYPGKLPDLLLQQVGRALREHKGKDSARIIDIVDANVNTLNSHWHKRRRSYKKWGFKIVGNGVKDRIVLPIALRDPKSAARMVKQRRGSHPTREITYRPTPRRMKKFVA